MVFKKIKTISAFVFLWIFISAALFSVLYLTGLMPSYMKDFVADAEMSLINSPVVSAPAFSVKGAEILVPAVGIDSAIVFPTSTDKNVLDKALYGGVAHYPSSSLPGENGNVFIFGHSTNKEFVHNQAFTAFTKLHNVKVGDDIIIKSNGAIYYYRVTSAEILSPDKAKIYMESNEPKLTLTTCWPVGNPLDRTVVEAKYIGMAAGK